MQNADDMLAVHYGLWYLCGIFVINMYATKPILLLSLEGHHIEQLEYELLCGENVGICPSKWFGCGYPTLTTGDKT